MAKHRSIPLGFMTVGEAAKKIGVTVRTLQYYDKEGLLSPSAESIRKKIEQLTASLTAIEQLKEEVLQMQAVNFKKYADIIVNLQMKIKRQVCPLKVRNANEL